MVKSMIRRWIPRWLPLGTILPYGLIFGFQCAIYFFTELYVRNLDKMSFHTVIDAKIPFVEPFIYIYLSCYILWIINIPLAGNVSKNHFYKLCTTSLICVLISGVCFVLFPVTIDRPTVTGTGLTASFVRFLYKIDSPVNLFPSLHCISSWLAYVAVRGQDVIPKPYRIFSCVYAISICISTQVLKQHFLADLVVGVALVELVWYLVRKTNFYTFIENFFERINERLGFHW